MKLMQKKKFKKFIGADDKSGLTLPNFIKLSKSLGFETCFLNKENQLEKDLRRVLRSKSAMICEVMMPPMQELVPRVQTQMNKDGTFEPAMLDNMYPFFLKKKLKQLKII